MEYNIDNKFKIEINFNEYGEIQLKLIDINLEQNLMGFICIPNGFLINYKKEQTSESILKDISTFFYVYNLLNDDDKKNDNDNIEKLKKLQAIFDSSAEEFLIYCDSANDFCESIFDYSEEQKQNFLNLLIK